MELTTIWFVLIAVLWTGYFVLEGFDFGVGALLPVLSRGHDDETPEKRKRLMLTTIGPHWDGNEVWLITAVGAMFAAFPVWYALLFSSLYLPMLLVLLVLIVRNVGLEYRHKRQDRAWTRGWDWCIVLGSLVAPFTLGAMLTALVGGLPVDGDGRVTGAMGALARPEAVLGGLTLTALAVVHGAFFLTLKTRGSIRDEARTLGLRLGPLAALLVVAYALWLGLEDRGAAVITGLSVIALVFALAMTRQGSPRSAFAGTAVAIASIVAGAFVRIFPTAVPSSLDPAWSLTLTDAASASYTLTIMTWVAVIFLPITLIYTGYSYWVFRRRIGTDQLAVH